MIRQIDVEQQKKTRPTARIIMCSVYLLVELIGNQRKSIVVYYIIKQSCAEVAESFTIILNAVVGSYIHFELKIAIAKMVMVPCS